MKDLKNQAIILIYPDGEIEKIPITIYKTHPDYFKEHAKTSKRFKNIFANMIIGSDVHYLISRLLGMYGVIEIVNKDMCIKIENALYYEQFSPEFYFYYPENLGSLEQLNAFVKIEQEISIDKKIFNEYSDAIFNYNNRSYSEYVNWKENNKNRFENEKHKL